MAEPHLILHPQGDLPFDLGDSPFGLRDSPFGLRDAPFGLRDALFGLGDAPSRHDLLRGRYRPIQSLLAYKAKASNQPSERQ